MGDVQGLMSLKHAEITVGQTLMWPVYNQDGDILSEAGLHIESEQQLKHLLDVGYCNADFLWDSIPAKLSDPLPATTTAASTVASALPSITAEPSLTTLPATQPGMQSGNPGSQPKPEELNKESVIELDSVRWHVGEVFFLQTQDNAGIRYTVRLIGYAKNKSLMLTAPMLDGKAALIREGQGFIVRAFPGKKAYAFTSSLIKYVYSPFPYLHLAYPREVRATTIRQAARATVKIIASVTIGNPEQTAAASLGDLSMGGTSGIIKRQLGRKGDTGTVKFRVNAAGSDEYLSLNVILRSVAPTDNGLEFRHGFEFVDLSPQARLILSAFVHQTLAETN
ncbi:flagellar brake protein [Undibacterium sp. CY7W]|uniref:Flagellar brake protein n=1 Tax=Undibacterium rugosum TaxID=2762291 RepID=A0A923HZS7_9BURK|nr:flagellar brake protein [Undibacterium rugosum]MBC3935026.1 flagellar brake protein [Undibacterium rugosum]